jgi:hypothetical protein
MIGLSTPFPSITRWTPAQAARISQASAATARFAAKRCRSTQKLSKNRSVRLHAL